jgi:UDPglucose--hexose-1-phosphate uridylyltransferase
MTPPQTLVLPTDGQWRVRVVPNLYPALERQEVVVSAPDHVRSIVDLSDTQFDLIAEAWRRRRADVPNGYLHALFNEGRESGASLPHSHSQLAWLPQAPPPEPPREGETVDERNGLVLWSPRVARVPYEVAIGPADPEPDGFESSLLAPALRALANAVRRIRTIEGTVPFNAWLHNGAGGWRIVLFPRLSVLAALELGGGIYVNTLAPEEAAARLRGAG